MIKHLPKCTSLKSNAQNVDKNLVCEDCDPEENKTKPVNSQIKPDIQNLNDSFISVLETMKTQLEDQDKEESEPDGELGTFSVKAVTNEKTIQEIADLLEKCYKLNDAVKGSSATKILAKELSKEVKEQSIKLSKSVIKKQFIGLSGGAVGEALAAIGSVYSLTSTTIELCDSIQLGSRVYGSFTSLKDNSSSVIELVKDALSKKCEDNGDTDDTSELVTNLTQKLSVRADNFLALLNKISLAGTRKDIETQLTTFETGQSGFNANAQATKDKMKDECDEDYSNECKASDFVADQKTKTKGPNKKTITCRVFYENTNIPRTGDVNELKKLLTETNKARRMVKNSTTITLDPVKPYRTFAVARINNFDFIYDMNTNVEIKDKNGNLLPNFADKLPEKDKRFFVDYNNIAVEGFNSTHAEVKILEHIARNYCDNKPVGKADYTNKSGTIKKFNIYTCLPIKVDYFTDRATCPVCSSTIKNFIKQSTSGINEVGKGISLNAKNFDFQSGSQYGIFYSGEMIKAQDINFFNSLKIR